MQFPPLIANIGNFLVPPSPAEMGAEGGEDIVLSDRVSTKVFFHRFRNFVINCFRYLRSLMKHVSSELVQMKHVFQNPYLFLKIYLHKSFWRHNLQSGPHPNPDLQEKRPRTFKENGVYTKIHCMS